MSALTQPNTLDNQTPAEAHQSLLHNVDEWRGALSHEAYFRREAHLATQALTVNGGLGSWQLSAHGDGTSDRQQLCACETIRKRALFGNGMTGSVEDVVCFGVASVFTPPARRGNGHASEMFKLLAKHCDGEDQGCKFSVLYSDIGKKFYARHGWRPRESSHLRLQPSHSAEHDPDVKLLTRADIDSLCAEDEGLIRARVARLAKQGKNSVAVIPDADTLRWQLARESFVSKEIYDKEPETIGAMATTKSGIKVWCWWTRWWYNVDPKEREGNTLHILRLAVADAEYDDTAADVQKLDGLQGNDIADAIAKLLAAAQVEAGKWTMENIEIWNPSSSTLVAARKIDAIVAIEHREKDSITSLRWCDPDTSITEGDLIWMANEKISWC